MILPPDKAHDAVVSADSFLDPSSQWGGGDPAPYPLAFRRAATARRGAVRMLRSDRGLWCVVSEQPAPERADGWVLLVDTADGQRPLASFPQRWMLLSENELRTLIHAD